MKTTIEEIRQAYVNEVAIYDRWLAKTKAKYGDEYANKIMSWGDTDYKDVVNWNDAMKMVERVLGLTKEEIEQVSDEAKTLAVQPGKDTPWNYWKETPIT